MSEHQGCPFHRRSIGVWQDGDLQVVSCEVCGEYRISRWALQDLERHAVAPSDWRHMLLQKNLISRRDTQALHA